MAGSIHTSSWWTSNNPIVPAGQAGVESDTNALKIGDGLTAWNSLPYQDEREVFSPATGTNTYVASYTFETITGYYKGQQFRIKFANANTGASTININSIGAANLKKNGGADNLQNGDIIAGGIYQIEYDGTNFQIVINTAL